MDTKLVVVSARQQLVIGILFVVVALCFQATYLFTMSAIYKLSFKNPIFIVFFSQGIVNIISLTEFTWLGLEIMANRVVPIADTFSTFIYRSLEYSAGFHVLLISLNRVHAIFSPMHYQLVWTKRLTFYLCMMSWVFGSCVSFLSVYLVDADPSAFTGHSIKGLALKDYAAFDPTVYGGKLQLFFNQFFNSSLNYFALFIYLLAFMKLMWERWDKREAPQQIRDQMNRRAHLFLMCFVGFLPIFLANLSGFVFIIAYPYSNIIVAVLIMCIMGIEPFVLLLLSKMVRQNLPFVHKLFPENSLFRHSKTVVISFK